jgi:ankyrin repeat protein
MRCRALAADSDSENDYEAYRVLKAYAAAYRKASTGDGRTGTNLQRAALSGKLGGVLAALSNGAASVDAVGSNRATALHMAAEGGHLECVQALLVAKADIEAAGEDGATALHLAGRGGHWEIVVELLAAGANPNAVDAEGSSVLHWVAASSNIDCTLAVLLYGADPVASNQEGQQPADWAAASNTEYHRACGDLILQFAEEWKGRQRR